MCNIECRGVTFLLKLSLVMLQIHIVYAVCFSLQHKQLMFTSLVAESAYNNVFHEVLHAVLGMCMVICVLIQCINIETAL